MELPQLERYGFSEIATSHDHVVALGSSVTLNFHFSSLNENPSMLMHSVHCFEPEHLKDRREIMLAISQLQNETVTFINDFEVPYVHIKQKFPRLKKKPKKARMRGGDDDSHDDDEEHEEEDHDDDDEDKDNDDDG